MCHTSTSLCYSHVKLTIFLSLFQHSYSHLLQHGIGAEAAEPSDSGRHVDLYQRSKKSGQVAEDKMTLKQFFTNVSLELEAEIDAKAALASKSKSALGQL